MNGLTAEVKKFIIIIIIIIIFIFFLLFRFFIFFSRNISRSKFSCEN